MKIVDAIVAKLTGNRFIEVPLMKLKVSKEKISDYTHPTYLEEYAIEIKLGYTIRVGEEGISKHIQRFKDDLIFLIYNDLFELVRELDIAIASRDYKEASEISGKIKEIIFHG